MIDGFGLGVGFSGKTDDTYLGLYEQQQRTAAMQEQQRQKALADAAQGQGKNLNDTIDTVLKGKVHPHLQPFLRKRVDKFYDDVMQLQRKNPTGYTNDFDFLRLKSELYADANDYVAKSPIVYDMENPKANMRFVPGREAAQGMIKAGDLEGWTQMFGEKGLPMGEMFYEDKDLKNEFLKRLDSNIPWGETKLVQKPGKYGTLIDEEVQYRDSKAAQAEAMALYESNQNVIKYKHPEYAGNPEKFVQDYMAFAPLKKSNPSSKFVPERDGDGGSGGGETLYGEKFLRHLGGVQNIDSGNWVNKYDRPEDEQKYGKGLMYNESVKGTPLGKVTINILEGKVLPFDGAGTPPRPYDPAKDLPDYETVDATLQGYVTTKDGKMFMRVQEGETTKDVPVNSKFLLQPLQKYIKQLPAKEQATINKKLREFKIINDKSPEEDYSSLYSSKWDYPKTAYEQLKRLAAKGDAQAEAELARRNGGKQPAKTATNNTTQTKFKGVPQNGF